MFDILIKNGHVVDGTANPWFKADVGIKEGRFTDISSSALEDGDRIIDAKGLIVAPGFIDPHGHSDARARPEKRVKYKAYDGINNVFNFGYYVLRCKIHKYLIKAKLEPYLGLRARTSEVSKK